MMSSTFGPMMHDRAAAARRRPRRPPTDAESRRDSRERGRLHEELVVRSLQRDTRPWWIMEVRAATEEEDHRGIDVVVETVDRGTLFLQVKSSKREAQKWRSRHRHMRDARVIVIATGDDLNTIYGRALGALILLREESTLR